jgi:hypothetical protein
MINTIRRDKWIDSGLVFKFVHLFLGSIGHALSNTIALLLFDKYIIYQRTLVKTVILEADAMNIIVLHHKLDND